MRDLPLAVSIVKGAVDHSGEMPKREAWSRLISIFS